MMVSLAFSLGDSLYDPFTAGASFSANARFFCADLYGRHSQVGSLAGAAHLLNDNTGVLR